MNNLITKNIIRFTGLMFLQVLILNQLNFFGFLNPFVYVLFIILYPIGVNRTSLILISFLTGFIIDLFLDTGGIHAAATVSIGYVRPIILKFSYGAAYEYQSIKVNDSEIYQKLSYFSLMILFHHLILFTLIFFSLNKFNLILIYTILTVIFTLILSLLLNNLFNDKK